MSKIKGIILISLILANLLAVTQQCTCMRTPGVYESLVDSTAVLTGQVVDITEYSDHLSVLLKVGLIWKGYLGYYYRVNTAKSTAICGFDFQYGQSYLVYIDGNYGGNLTVSFCSRTKLMQDAYNEMNLLSYYTQAYIMEY